jgi:hypothetical protein
MTVLLNLRNLLLVILLAWLTSNLGRTHSPASQSRDGPAVWPSRRSDASHTMT